MKDVDVDPIEAMIVWEFYLENPTMMDKLPDEGVVARRSYVLSVITPIVSKYHKVAISAGFDASFDWEFVPIFLKQVHDMFHVDDIEAQDFSYLAKSIATGTL